MLDEIFAALAFVPSRQVLKAFQHQSEAIDSIQKPFDKQLRDDLPQWKSYFVVYGNSYRSQRRPPQRIRVLAPRRLLVDRPESDQRVDLVRKRDRDRHRIARHEIIWPLRPVVILAGVRDDFVL